jgi:hypothetical protein
METMMDPIRNGPVFVDRRSVVSREVFDDAVSKLATAMTEAKEREARHWIEIVGPHGIYQEHDARTEAWRLVDSVGGVFSEIRVEHAGYVLTIVVDRCER